MASSYKLHYFNFMGLAEPIRLIFAYANVEYEDIRIDKKEEWPKLKSTFQWGQLPVLELPDGSYLAQSSAMMRYLAAKYNLVGESDLERAKCDEYTGVVEEMRIAIGKHFNTSPENKEEAQKQLLEVSMPRYCNVFQDIIQSNGTGYLVGDKLSYADIFLAFMLGQIAKTVKPGYLEERFPELAKYEKRVLNQPGIKEWVAKRPETAY